MKRSRPHRGLGADHPSADPGEVGRSPSRLPFTTPVPCSERDTETLLPSRRGPRKGRLSIRFPNELLAGPPIQEPSPGQGRPTPRGGGRGTESGPRRPRPSWHGPSSVSTSSGSPVCASTREPASHLPKPNVHLATVPLSTDRCRSVLVAAVMQHQPARSASCWTCRPSKGRGRTASGLQPVRYPRHLPPALH